MSKRPQRIDSTLLEAIGTAPREVLPALLVALAARLAEPEPAPPPLALVPDGDRLLTPEEAALRLGIDVSAVAGRGFPFMKKLGRRTYRYSEQGLEAWIRGGR